MTIKTDCGGVTSLAWVGGWLFTIGYLKLAFWAGVWAFFIWPYDIGAALSHLHP